MNFVRYEDLVGKRALEHIVDTRGVLLVSAGTILREHHVEKLRNFDIDLTDIRVEEVPPEALRDEPEEERNSDFAGKEEQAAAERRHLISQTLHLLSGMDRFIQKNGAVPVAELETQVVPVIRQLTGKGNIFRLLSDLKSMSDYRYKQSIGVLVLSAKLGHWLGLGERDLSLLTAAACLHDIGSVKLPSYLLNKPERFAPNEFEIMKQHTRMGYELLKDSGVEHRVALVALQHHERENGSGYPEGLKGHEMDEFSKMIAIADVYTALTSERPYRPAFRFFEAVREIHQGIMEGKYDARIGQICLKGLMEAQVGSEVLLTDGTRGKILLINPNYPTRPMVMAGNRLIDLSKETNLQISEVIG